jgi:hypothetical protein
MMHEARLVTDSRNGGEVCRSIGVDNVSMPGLSAETAFDGKRVTTTIQSNSIGGLLNTVDDLLRCQIAAESLIKDG